ncbi:MAG: AraC family transcriptional regulator [Ferruginibacter sp.]
MFVKEILTNMGLHCRMVELGEVHLIENKITDEQHDLLKGLLFESGLVLMESDKTMLTEKIKNLVVEIVDGISELPKPKISTYISKRLDHDYTHLANIFSFSTGTTIEHYIIKNKIEKAKKLILNNEMNLTEISYQLNYSSVAHLSTQFKKVTGQTPTYFKNLHACINTAMLKTI